MGAENKHGRWSDEDNPLFQNENGLRMTLTSIVTNPRERTRFLKFATVGIIGAVVDFGTFNLLSTGLNLPVVWASIISFIAATLSNFTCNRYWTYPDSRSKPMTRQLIQFAFVSVVGLAIRTPIVVFMERLFGQMLANVEYLPVGFITSQLVAENLALATAVIVVMFWNFFINRYWTYNDIS
jgi:putative flippase GtrA